MAFTHNPKLISRAGGRVGGGELLYVPEAAGQSYKKGELVVEVAGALTAVASDAVLIRGQAQQDATGTAGSVSGLKQAVTPILPGDVWEFETTATVTEAMRGLCYALTVTSNVHYIDCTDTGHDFATFSEPVYSPLTGALQAKALFEILPSACQGTSASGT